MKNVCNIIVKQKFLILLVTLLLMLPSIIGYVVTKINYDILVYLTSDIETLKGEKILTDDFNMGAFSIVIADNMESKDIIKLEEKFRNIETVEHVVSINDILGTNIPVEILPDEIKEKVANGDSRLILVTFSGSTSDDKTLAAVEEMRQITDDNTKIGGMSAMVLDTKELFNSEMLLYVVIAVILCIVVLELSLDSYVVPFLLMINIGIAILFNMGSNIIFGNISYITKAIAAVLQLGVTTDFSIFLYHKYEKLKKEYKDSNKAMSEAIHDTFISVFGSSLTTIAGFLALCTMKLTLGVDIGLVMAKGVLIGVICVLTVFPALLLMFDKSVEKTKHKELLPKFDKIKKFVLKNYIYIFIVFIVLLIPAYFAQSKTTVYYKLDESIPENYGYSIATRTLREDYGMVSQEMILVSKDTENYTINKMISEIENVDGIDLVLSSTSLTNYGITDDMIPERFKKIYETDNYKMIIIASHYDIATDELNNQIEVVNKIIKKYDKDAILAGEGPLMKDLVTTTDIDFKNVNFASVGVIFVLMMIVLKSITLPVLLVTAIEFAIFINMGVPYFTGTEIPFIASVVIGTIQLGATIDYAILMTTKYLEERSNGLKKKDAVKSALDNSVTSIFVSAMCFFAATIGVGIVSKIDMIGSLCRLISRGAIISMIVVVMVVPSILLIFDKVIMKTTYLKKEKKNMKKINKVLASSLVLAIVLNPVSVFALTKEETVYSKLNGDGSVNTILVNEHLVNSDNSDQLTDLTDLENIININSDSKYDLNNNKITWDANGSDIFYQGTTKKNLPINTNITYKLNNKEIKLDDLLGKSGTVEITIEYTNTAKNSVRVNGKLETLYTPFVVSTVTNIKGDNNSNLKVTNGKAIDNGIGYTVVGLSAPGLYESLNIKELKDLDTVTIKFDTIKFELSSIYSVATSKVLDSSDLEIFNKLSNVYGSIDKLQTSMNQIEEGSKTILNNLSLISDGSTKISDSLNVVLENLEKIKEGTISLDSGLTQVVESLNNSLSMFTDLDSKLANMQTLIDANTAYINGLKNIKSSYEKLVAYKLSGATLTEDEQAQLIALKFSYDNFNLGDSKTSLITVLNGNNQALESSIEAFKNMKNAITKLNTYLPLLKNGADSLSDGTSKLTSGVEVLTGKMNELSDGTSKLKDGMDTLNTGITTFNNEGIKAISEVARRVQGLSSKIEALSNLSNNYQSFSIKDDNTKSNTKFILVVEGKKVKEEKKEVKKTTKKQSFFDRLLNLFK